MFKFNCKKTTCALEFNIPTYLPIKSIYNLLGPMTNKTLCLIKTLIPWCCNSATYNNNKRKRTLYWQNISEPVTWPCSYNTYVISCLYKNLLLINKNKFLRFWSITGKQQFLSWIFDFPNNSGIITELRTLPHVC